MGEKLREKNEIELNDEELDQKILRHIKEQDEKLRQNIEKDFGGDVLKEAEQISHSLDNTIKNHLLERGDTEKAKEILEIWRDFASEIYVRLTASNLRNPEMVENVLKMAAALVQPEANQEGKEAVKEGKKILERRYG